MPFVTWVHSITAGVDHLLCPALIDSDITLSNAKGVYAHSLAEYVITACMYFAKDIPRLIQQKVDKNYNRFFVSELKGRTMGIVGYGNIGQTCARMAKTMGMKVIALRKNPHFSISDPFVDDCVGVSGLKYIMEQSDYLLVVMALTNETKKFISRDALKHAKKSMVLINIGRGALVDEAALVDALHSGAIAGAALDVFTVEPLPESSPLWTAPNLLLSPHNADWTRDGRHSSVRYFTECVKKFINNEDLDCIVDKKAGY